MTSKHTRLNLIQSPQRGLAMSHRFLLALQVMQPALVRETLRRFRCFWLSPGFAGAG